MQALTATLHPRYRIHVQPVCSVVLERVLQTLMCFVWGQCMGIAQISKAVKDTFKRTHGLLDLLYVDPNDETSLGLEFASGLESPKLALPSEDDPIWRGGSPTSGQGMPGQMTRGASSSIRSDKAVSA